MPNTLDEHGAPNKRPPDPSPSPISNPLQSYTLQAEFMKPRKLILIPVDKYRFDRIREKISKSLNMLSRSSLKKEIYLGISTTCLGAFLGWVPDLYKMVDTSSYDITLIFYLGTLLVGIYCFFAFKAEKHDSDVSPIIRDIQSELDAITNSIDGNYTPSNALQQQNHFPKSD